MVTETQELTTERPRSEEEQRVFDALYQARQNTKEVVKKLLESERVSAELLNMRFGAYSAEHIT